MKKLLIASAALAMVAGTVQAQSSVTVYGAYGNSWNQSKVNGVKAAAVSQGSANDQLYTTNLGFKGTEDLGGGNSAFFTLEGDLSGTGVLGGATTTTNQTNIFNRQAHVGLKTAYGTLTVGRQNDSVKDTEGLAQVYNLSDNNKRSNFTTIGDRIANATKYATPVWNGLSATYTYSNNAADAVATGIDGDRVHNSYAINYKLPVNGGVDLAYAHGEEKSAGSTQTGETSRISARTVVLGDLTVGAAYTTNQAAATAPKVKSTLVSVSKPFGNYELKAHYAKISADSGVGTDTEGLDGNAYGVMGVYNLSKRTSVYAGYLDADTTDAASKLKITTVGLVHKF
jgi:predicted porin